MIILVWKWSSTYDCLAWVEELVGKPSLGSHHITPKIVSLQVDMIASTPSFPNIIRPNNRSRVLS